MTKYKVIDLQQYRKNKKKKKSQKTFAYILAGVAVVGYIVMLFYIGMW